MAIGAAVGVDNMRASAGLGFLVPEGARQRWLAAVVLSDAAALILGALLGSFVPDALSEFASRVGFLVLVVLGVGCFGRGDETEALVERPLVGAGLPLLLSLDNLAAGAALIAIGYPRCRRFLSRPSWRLGCVWAASWPELGFVGFPGCRPDRSEECY